MKNMSGSFHPIQKRDILRLFKRAKKMRRKFQATSIFDERVKALDSYLYLTKLASEKISAVIKMRAERLENLSKISAPQDYNTQIIKS